MAVAWVSVSYTSRQERGPKGQPPGMEGDEDEGEYGGLDGPLSAVHKVKRTSTETTVSSTLSSASASIAEEGKGGR